MEEASSSVKICSRKRKRNRPSSLKSNSLIGILTRSKSRKYFEHNFSIARPEPVSGSAISFVPDIETVKAILEVNCNNGSRVSSIKDLRIRRVFTPDVNSVLEEEEEDQNEKGKQLLKGSDSSQIVVTDLGDAKVNELEKSEILLSEAQGRSNDMKNGLSLKDQTEKGSIFKSKMVLNRCGRKKVFKASNSFSYRRLLPYLMDIANDDSSVQKIEIVDAGIPCKLQKLDVLNSEVPSIAGNSYTAKLERAVPQFDDTKPSESEGIQKLPTKVPFNQQDLSGAEKESGQTAEIIRAPNMEQESHEDDVNRVGFSMEEGCSQMTPPNPDIFGKTEVGSGGESAEAKNFLAENQNFKGLSAGSEKSKDVILRQSPNGKQGTNSINRSVLNPCSRLRLFKNPRSPSYRKLLPFLMGISKNNSCASRIAQNPMPQVDLEEVSHPISAATAEQKNLNKGSTENSYEKQHTEDLGQELQFSPASLSPLDGSSPDTINSPASSTPQSSSTNYSLNIDPSSVTSEALPDPCTLINLQTEGMPESHSSSRKLELGSEWKENCSASPPAPTVNNGILTVQSTSEEPGPVRKQKMCLDMGLELCNDNSESIEKINFNQSSFQVKVPDALVSSTSGPLKGILKGNRRGCRGLCNCLNCASFRLHADKAFEFSRNQMQDAEEITSELMQELANLRLLLEKSIINDNDLTAIQLNPVLIKQACNKALETENLAKERLSQLNYDLNVHCRIPVLLPPKVTFANYVQERAIPTLDPSTSTEKKG